MRLQALTGEVPPEPSEEPSVKRYFPAGPGELDAIRDGRKRALAYWTIPGLAPHAPQDGKYYTPDRVTRLVNLSRYQEGLPFLADAELMWQQGRPKELWDAKSTSARQFRYT